MSKVKDKAMEEEKKKEKGEVDTEKGERGGEEQEVAKTWLSWEPFQMWTRVEMPLGQRRERSQVIKF